MACKGTSVHFLTSPLLSYSPPVHMYFPLHLCAISRDHTQSRQLSYPMVWWLSRGRLTRCRRLSAPSSTRTSAASDKPRTHWDRSVWHYGTLAITWIPIYGRLGTRRLGTVILCISFVARDLRAFSLDFPWLSKCCILYLPSFIYLLWISLG
jgi:hypothetical protein